MTDASYAGRTGVVGEPFSIGRAFGGAMSIFQQGFGKFFAVSAIMHIPLLLVFLLTLSNPLAKGIGTWATLLLFSPLSTATCLFGAYQIRRGREFNIGEGFSVAFSRFLPLLGASLLGGLMTIFFTLLLIVPGLICACMIAVAQPACVIERLGPVECLGRSRELTKGYRWQIFGLIIGLSVAGGVVGGILGAISALVAGSIGVVLAQVAIQSLFGAFGAVLYSVIYSGLREAKEGVDVDQLARVFD